MKTTTTNASNNAPLRGSKRTTLEGGVRVPFCVQWPGQLAAGQVYDRPVIQLDIFPTVLAAAGISLPNEAQAEGVDLIPYFTGAKTASPHEALYWRFGKQMAIRQGDWKLVRYDGEVDGMPKTITNAKLYNLRDDIGETRDLVDENPEKVKELQAAWDDWNRTNIAPRWGDGRAAGNRRRAGAL